MSAAPTALSPRKPAAAAPDDPRFGPVYWPLPDERGARRRAAAMALLGALLAVWYGAWLLQGQRVGTPVLFGLLVAAESFNVLQAIGFWWTCSRQRLRPDVGARRRDPPVDVMIPVYGEPIDVVEPTVAAATALRGGEVRVWLLDDGRSAEMEGLAERNGAGYITRPDNRGAKAGNINHALGMTSAPFVVVLDCDHVPRADFLERTLGHLEADDVAFVQTPQYYANAASSPVAAAAAAQQSLFFGPIGRGKDGMGAMFCCGTNFVFRRQALEEVGGLPEQSVTEDFELSVHIHERGWRSVYVPDVLACGLGPEDMASYVSQQQRWARGCLSAIPTVLRARLPWRLRLQYLLSATYFLSGWTLLIYMSLPVVRILFGAQPLAATSADQFLLHFAPYYCAALGAVAMAGYGTYTYGAFALAAGSFWIHVQAALNALLGRRARFVVTPKHGTRARQPRAVAPALAAAAVLTGVAAYGLWRDRSAATLNNVAFAALHASILLTAVIPALRLRSSAPLLPEPPRRRPPPRRRLPRPLALAATGAVLLIPVAFGVFGSRELADRPDLSQKAHDAARGFMDRYVSANGRVIRRDQGGDTVSEGQAYAMLLAVALNDRARFDSVWGWTRSNLQRPDGLLSYHWKDGEVVSRQPATDADLDAARALVLAGKRFGPDEYEEQGKELAGTVLDAETVAVGGIPVLVAGPWAGGAPAVLNPSYFSPRAYADLASVDDDRRWGELAASSRALSRALTRDPHALPPDWASVPSGVSGSAENMAAAAYPVVDPGDPLAVGGVALASSGLDAARLAVRSAESCLRADRRIAAGLWPLYRRNPGTSTYRLDGSARSRSPHATSFAAAAAAARAAGDGRASARLLDRAQAADDADPTYYGAAWVALGRVMLGSSALGACGPAS